VDDPLFAVDMRLGDPHFGYRSYRQTINAIDAMDMTEDEKKPIFEDNIRGFFRLPI
jgi:hypothetical protein